VHQVAGERAGREDVATAELVRGPRPSSWSPASASGARTSPPRPKLVHQRAGREDVATAELVVAGERVGREDVAAAARARAPGRRRARRARRLELVLVHQVAGERVGREALPNTIACRTSSPANRPSQAAVVGPFGRHSRNPAVYRKL